MQRAITRDNEMVVMLRGAHNPELVKAWMRDYGLFQGINAANREAAVACFLDFAEKHQILVGDTTDDHIAHIYADLFSRLYQAVQRSWVSATSKLLWCLYPETFVIYDAFVHRTLSVLQSLDNDLAGFPRIGEAPTVRQVGYIEAATMHYMNYQSLVRRLLEIHGELLESLRARHNEAYPYNVRILDKLLWMIGNYREAY